MPNALGQIFTGNNSGGGNGFGWGSLLPLASIPIGVAQSMMASGRNSDLFKTFLASEKARQAALTPDAIAAGTARLNQPLGLALQHAVGNSVQGDLAQRGLAQAPGIYSEAIAQALAPYAQKNLELAQQGYLEGVLGKRVQLPFGFQMPQGVDMTGILKQLMALRNASNSGMDNGAWHGGGTGLSQWGLGGSDPSAPNLTFPQTLDPSVFGNGMSGVTPTYPSVG